jgi:hypothetical protein
MNRPVHIPDRTLRVAWPQAGVLLDGAEMVCELPVGWVRFGPPGLLVATTGAALSAAAYAPAKSPLVPLFLPAGHPRVELRWPHVPGGLWACDGDPADLFRLLDDAGLPTWMLLVSGEGTTIQAVARQPSLPDHPLVRLLAPTDMSSITLPRYRTQRLTDRRSI